MLTLNDGRNELWQWDTGRTLDVDADCSQVHFSNKVFGRSNDVDVIDGIAIIPDILLQTDKDLTAWAFVGTAENGYTKISKTFKVNKRNKPADYVFTPPEQTSLEEIKEKIEYLESIQDPDAIKNAVEDYLEQNPVEAPVQSVNGYTGEVKLTAEDVGAISQDDLREATNKVLEQAKESGEFKGDPGYTPQKGKDYFDGDDYVLTPEDKKEIAEMAADLVEVPDSGGNVDLTGVVKSVNGQTPDENGNVEIAVSGGGLSATASALLINILRNAMYTADQRANITALENALFNGGTAPDVPDEPDVPVVTTYTIVNVLTNVTNSNSTAKVSEGASYIGKLTAADGFNMSTVTVTMGGVDVTADVYADGTITIESVTGNVIITASAVDDSATAPAFQLTSPLVLGDTTDPRINDTANNYVVTGETINDDEDWTICIDFASLTGANPPSKPIVQNGNKQFQIFYDATFWHIAAHGKYIGHNMLIDHSEGKLAGKNLVEVITYNSATKTYSGYGTVENTLTFDSFTTAAGGAVFINCSNAVGTVNRFALYKRVLSADEITEWIGG